LDQRRIDMSIAASVQALRTPAERIVSAWYDSERSGWAVWSLLGLFVLIWTLFQVIVHSATDLHFDMPEMYGWSRHPAFGYYKHPPLCAWLAGAWFAVFPTADWAYYLLAMTIAASGLFAVDLIARRYVSGDKRLLVLLLLLLTPFYQFLGELFNPNQVLLWLWPLATYCFLRAFETRRPGWSAAAGGVAALAMLGKYYSIYLVGSFILAALAHPSRWSYLKSLSPWVSAATGLAILAPHIHWLVTTGFQPLHYAFDVHGTTLPALALWKVGTYLAGSFAYVSLLLGAYWFAVRPGRRQLADSLWPQDPGRRMLVVLLAAQILLPALTAPLLGMRLSSLWSMSAWFLLPIVLLSPETVHVRRPQATYVALLVCGIAAGSMLVAPWLAWRNHTKGTRHGHEYYTPVAQELARQWRRLSDHPLRIVVGDANLSAAVSFYSPEHPQSVPILWLWAYPRITQERLAREGWAAVCRAHDTVCTNEAKRWQARDARASYVEVEVARWYLGHRGKPEKFVLLVAPPAERPLSE
jgi:4-amino-4-deoxy-L-arabinose transferase-like glycosyltransferase